MNLEKPLESWFKSRDVCRAFGGELLSITSSQEFYFIKNLLLSNISAGAIWLGLNDLLKEGIWEWTDKSPLNLANWIDGQPNSYGGLELSYIANFDSNTLVRLNSGDQQSGLIRKIVTPLSLDAY